MMNVSEVILEYLKTEGVGASFGIAGTHHQAFINELNKSGIRYFSAKHEAAAGFMALFYTRITGKPSLLIATAGSGITSAICAIAEMYKSETPVFILTPVISSYVIGRNPFQDNSGIGQNYSIINMMKYVTRKSELVMSPELIPHHMQSLLRKMNGAPPGPVLLQVPADFFTKQAASDALNFSTESYRTVFKSLMEMDKINLVSRLIRESKKPVLLVGGRCYNQDIPESLSEFISKLKIPYIDTYESKGVVSQKHPLYAGMMDCFGHRSSEIVIKQSDLVIAVGCNFGELQTIKYDPTIFKNSKLVSIDSNPYDVGVNYPVIESILGDISFILQKLTEDLASLQYSNPINDLEFKNQIAAMNEFHLQEATTASKPMNLSFFYRQLSNLLNDNDLIIADIGNSSGFSILRNLYTGKRGFYSVPFNYSMGSAISGCIGAKIGAQQKNIICITGDGSFLMYLGEVMTAIQYKLGITWIIMVNEQCGAIDLDQKMMDGGNLEFGSQIKLPDLGLFARSCGMRYHCVQNEKDLQNAVTVTKECSKDNLSSLITVYYKKDYLPSFKPRFLQGAKDMSPSNGLKSTPYMIETFAKIL